MINFFSKSLSSLSLCTFSSKMMNFCLKIDNCFCSLWDFFVKCSTLAQNRWTLIIYYFEINELFWNSMNCFLFWWTFFKFSELFLNFDELFSNSIKFFSKSWFVFHSMNFFPKSWFVFQIRWTFFQNHDLFFIFDELFFEFDELFSNSLKVFWTLMKFFTK